MTVLEGVYKQSGLPDQLIPLAVGADGTLATSGSSGGSTGGLSNTELRSTAVAVEPLGIPSVSRQVAVTVTSANQALTGTCKRISIKARTCDMRFVVGTGVQTANATTSHFIEAGERLDIAVPLNANIAVIRDTAATANGTLCITEMT